MTKTTSLDLVFDTKQKKLAFFQNIILVAIADRYLDEQESGFLLSIGEQLNLSEADTLPITDNLPSLSFIIPTDGLQKALELQNLVMMVLQDGTLEEREYNLCLEYTRRIGFSRDILDEMVSELLQN